MLKTNFVLRISCC